MLLLIGYLLLIVCTWSFSTSSGTTSVLWGGEEGVLSRNHRGVKKNSTELSTKSKFHADFETVPKNIVERKVKET